MWRRPIQPRKGPTIVSETSKVSLWVPLFAYSHPLANKQASGKPVGHRHLIALHISLEDDDPKGIQIVKEQSAVHQDKLAGFNSEGFLLKPSGSATNDPNSPCARYCRTRPGHLNVFLSGSGGWPH